LQEGRVVPINMGLHADGFLSSRLHRSGVFSRGLQPSMVHSIAIEGCRLDIEGLVARGLYSAAIEECRLPR